MPCLLLLIAIFLPRLTLALIFFFTNWFAAAFQTILWPLLGFLFMPYTTLAWMAAMLLNDRQLSGIYLILLIIAVMLDMGTHGGSARHRRN